MVDFLWPQIYQIWFQNIPWEQGQEAKVPPHTPTNKGYCSVHPELYRQEIELHVHVHVHSKMHVKIDYTCTSCP